MKTIAGLSAGAVCALLLGACTGAAMPYENLNGRQLRGLPMEAPPEDVAAPPQAEDPGAGMPS